MLLNHKLGGYKFKFGREPRRRTISELHSLYTQAKLRSDKIRNEFRVLIDEIISKTKEVDVRGEKKHIVYFTEDNTVHKYTFSYRSGFDSWGYSIDRLRFEGSVTEKRDELISFILENEIAFELGEKFRKLDTSFLSLEYKVIHVLIQEIREELVNRFKDIHAHLVPNVIPVEVNNQVMIFSKKSQSYGFYKDFEYVGDMTEIVKL